MNYAYLFQFGGSTFVLCSCAFVMTMANGDISKLLFLISFTTSMTMEIAFPSYFGTVLTAKSETLTMEIYKSNWIEQDARFKKAFCIFVARTFQPIITLAGGLFQLSLPTLLKVKGIRER